ncbi:MAG: hypothetical protein AB7P17_01450 [Nitrospirales bacterium]|nr:hypothetical protein [Nitrospirales bacterium]
MPYRFPSKFLCFFIMFGTLLSLHADGPHPAQATEKPLVDPCTRITVNDLAKLIGQKVSEPKRSGMYDEGDHACEYELSDGSGPIEIRTFPGDTWDSIPSLHPDASNLSGVGGEALHYRDENIGYVGIYVRKKPVVVEVSMPFSSSAEKFITLIAQHIYKKL